jgi:serine/threonine protein kinase
MLPVAEMNLHELQHELDSMQPGPSADAMKSKLLGWSGCLLRALDYIHEMRVKHRDIKPSNILVRNSTVYFTDFGVAKELTHAATTGSYATVGAFTPRYAAPELSADGSRRGRATDIYSLGCIFLEIATILVAPPGSLEHLHQFFVSQTGSLNYASNTQPTLQWIWHIWAYWAIKVDPPAREDLHARHGVAIADLAFFMMDPHSAKRITSRQLIALVIYPRTYYFGSINGSACDACGVKKPHHDPNIPLHSRFRDEVEYPNNPDHALEESPAADWEDAKRKWLQQHVWWN